MPLPFLKALPPNDPHSIRSVLHSLTTSRSLSAGEQLHTHLLKSGFLSATASEPDVTTSLCNHLINFYSKCRLPDSSLRVFQECHFHRRRSSWSSIISAFAQNDIPDSSLHHFRAMLRDGKMPDDHTFPSVSKACGALGDLSVGRSLHCLALKIAYECDVFVASSLVDMYAKCAATREARQVFDQMPHKNVVSWSGMICGYSQMGLYEEAIRLFREAVRAGGVQNSSCVNDFTYSDVLKACSEWTLLQLGCQVHAHTTKTSFTSSPFVASGLISLYSKCGLVEDAYQVFSEATAQHGRAMNLGVWNSMLIACAQHGHTQNAFRCFREMAASGTAPNFITFLGLLYSCSHAGLVEEGMRYFRLMTVEHGIEAEPQHYATVVDLLGRAGRLQEAVDFISQMPIDPPESVWASLLTGCRIHKDTETAAYAAARLEEIGSRSSGALVLLSNAYAAAGNYSEASRARKAMRDKGVRKEAGISWVELGGMVYSFVSGDQLHPRAADIYKKLGEVGDKIARAGYSPDTTCVLRDVSEEEKRAIVGWHSERLAVAFWLVVVSDTRRPVRVMKNLRVCADCHVWLKFLTRCTGRVVILRDNTRFHRFENGVCSCGDFW